MDMDCTSFSIICKRLFKSSKGTNVFLGEYKDDFGEYTLSNEVGELFLVLLCINDEKLVSLDDCVVGGNVVFINNLCEYSY